jgi:hypothetical protein
MEHVSNTWNACRNVMYLRCEAPLVVLWFPEFPFQLGFLSGPMARGGIFTKRGPQAWGITEP